MSLNKKVQFSDSAGSSLLSQVDEAIVTLMAESSIPLLRVSLGIVYVWFGVLKIIGASPVADLVEKSAILLPKEMFVRVVGVLELIIGIGLLFRAALHFTLPLFFFQIAGTFLPILFHPREAFQGNNPLLLTKNGEFILKNLVLLAAGLAAGEELYREDKGSRGQDK